MKAKCVKCGKLFDVVKITSLINICQECSTPDVFNKIFGGKDEGVS